MIKRQYRVMFKSTKPVASYEPRQISHLSITHFHYLLGEDTNPICFVSLMKG